MDDDDLDETEDEEVIEEAEQESALEAEDALVEGVGDSPPLEGSELLALQAGVGYAPMVAAPGGFLAAEPGSEPAPPAVQVIRASSYDDYLFDCMRRDVPQLGQALEQHGASYGETDLLAQDIFNSLYKPLPEVQEVDEAHQHHQRAIEEMLSTSDWQKLHAYTQLDPFATSLATAALSEQVVTMVQQLQQEKPDEQESRQKMRNASRRGARQAQKTINEAHRALDTFGGGDDEIGGGWGSGAGGGGRSGNIRTRVERARKVLDSHQLRRIAELAGRIRLIAANAQRKRVDHAADEVYGVSLGNDVSWLLSGELGLLASPKLKALFYRKLLERGLLQYWLSGHEPQGRGPIVLAIDESGSMSGLRIAWAMAVFLAFLSIAAKQKRDIRLIHFASSSELLVEDYPLGQGTPEAVMDSALHFFNGGTDYDEWMDKSLESILSSDFARADVVVISDGECAIDPARRKRWLQVKRDRGFRSFGILIGSHGGGSVLRQICDEVVHLSEANVDDGEVLSQAFSI